MHVLRRSYLPLLSSSYVATSASMFSMLKSDVLHCCCNVENRTRDFKTHAQKVPANLCPI